MSGTNIQKRLMVTGCGRSGTRYITFVLRRLGLHVGHETMKKDGIASWCTAIDSNHTPWGVSVRDYNFNQIIHQVRHPLKVIPSACSFDEASWHYICNHIPCHMGEPVLIRSAKYWYYWNLEAEKIAQWRYKIEDLNNIFDDFCERLGVPTDYSALESTPSDVNTRKSGRFVHLYDELMERLSLDSWTALREILKVTPANEKNHVLTWNELESLDNLIYLKIRDKAKKYGYSD